MSFSEDELGSIAGLFHLAGRLKNLNRQGWVDRGVEEPESVADHSWRLALMTLVVCSREPGIDAERAVRMALVHDLPEAITGDITPFDDRLGASDADREALFSEIPEYSQQAEETKTAAERRAMHDLTCDLPDELRTVLIDAWEEYEAGETAEARLVKQIDKLETWLQALEYQDAQSDLIIESFRRGIDRDITADELKELRGAIDQLFDTS